MVDLSLRELLEAGAHFGHQSTRWNPKMRPYIFGARNDIYIIDLQKTLRLFKAACEFVRELSAKGEKVLFIGTKPQAQEIVVEEANKAGMPYVTQRWLGGTLTNFSTIKRSISRLLDLDGMKGDGTFELLAKKEAVRREKDRLRLEKFLGGIRSLDELPKALFIVDTYREHIAVREGVKLGIPIIGIVDTNSDPGGIDYVLPGNDDALRSIRLFVSKIAESIIDGASLRSDTEEGEMAAVMSAGGSVGEEILAAAEGRKEEKD